MANLLKDLHLTSIDLVKNGANQQADICLFKSAKLPPTGQVISADDPARFDDITEI